jgi:phage tail tape-measure protein
MLGKSIAKKNVVLGLGLGANDIMNSYAKEGGFGPETQVTAAGVGGGTIGAAGGAKIGAVAGGFLGAWVGGVGAVPGAIVGGIIGGAIGGYVGSEGTRYVVRRSQRRRCR